MSRAASTLIGSPKHPYSQNLLASVPHLDPSLDWIDTVRVEGAFAPDQTGCRFRSRCQHAFDRCTADPGSYPVPGGGTALCFLYDEAGKTAEPATV